MLCTASMFARFGRRPLPYSPQGSRHSHRAFTMYKLRQTSYNSIAANFTNPRSFAPPFAMKLFAQIVKGKALRSDTSTLEEAGVVSATSTAVGLGEEGTFTQHSRLMLVGSTPSEVQVIMKGRKDMVTVRDDLRGPVVPKGYKRVTLNDPAGPPDGSPYRCASRK